VSEERVALRAERESTRECLFIGKSAQLLPLKRYCSAWLHRTTGRCCRWSVPNLHAKDNVSFVCTVHANGRCLITVSLHASAYKWTVHVVLHACMHEIYHVCVGALLCFFACKLVGTCCYLCAKNMDGAQLCVTTCYLLYSKRGARKRQEVGPTCRGARASECARRGGQARVRCGADGGGVGARAVARYRAKRASERDK
jgi:hypothetical protein